uniref:uncharacterized protein LOC120346791 n=1 Tax=Styela clava TaxID=7725 RepID=UPI00193ADFDF|nr:uncharacterized protein LOC120346791 [Styela clava]
MQVMEAELIVRITATGEFKLNIGNLTAVLHNLKCQDLAIVSMAGAYRTGKSFMLNFFIRYLRRRGWNNKNWFGPDHMKIQDGFEWRDGSIPHTLGIYVWPEIFYVERDGEQIGVLIVDTQGLFDDRSSPDTNAKIMSISSLLSSHQILNFQRNVRGTDLEHLQLALEYAHAATHKFQKKEKSFQKLTFLVRDWPNAREHEFGHGGDTYVKQVLRTTDSNQPESVTQVKKSIHKGFENVNGFLMSRPSRKIDGGGRSQDIRNSDITGNFREHIIMLVESVLHPKNLVVKKMFGQPISANGLTNLISEFSNWIQSGKQPKIETCLEGTIKANNATALQESVSKYRWHLKELVGSSFPSDWELQRHHEKTLEEAEELFHSMATLGSGRQTQDVWNRVKEECKMYYRDVKGEIRLRKAEKIEKLRAKAEKTEKEYEDKMNKLPTDISFETLEVRHLEYYSQAIDEYEWDATSLEGILSNDEDYIKKKLMARMEAFFEGLKQQRKTLENIKRFAKEEEKLKIQKVARDCFDIFQLEMAKILGEFIPGIDEVCRKEKRSILRKYGRDCESFTDKDEVEQCGYNLQEKLEDHCKKAVKKNKHNMEMLKSKCAELSQTAAHEYDEKMKNLMRQNQSYQEMFFDRKHSEFKKTAMCRFDDLLQRMSCYLPVAVKDKFKMKLDLAINEKYQVYKTTNDRGRMIQKMEEDSRECAHHAKTALGVYTHNMEQLLQNGKIHSEQELLQKHEFFEFKALRQFGDLTAHVTCSQDNFRKNLMKEMREKLFQYRQINRRNPDGEKQRHIESWTDEYEYSMMEKRRHIKSLTDEYEYTMMEWTERYCPEDDDMEMQHSMMLADVLEKFSRLMNSKNTAEDEEELEEEINEVYLKIEAENKRTRDEREFLKRQEGLSIRNLQVNSEIRTIEFIRKIKSYENRYEENFEMIFHDTMLVVLEEFDIKTECLGDCFNDEIWEARINLEKKMHEVLIRGIQRNNENRERVNDAVEAYVLEYREVSRELMLKAYVKTGGFELVEQRYIEQVDAQEGNEAIKELIKEKIRKETEEAELQNEGNREYRSVTADKATVGKYLAMGAINVTPPAWTPLGLVGLVLGGVVAGAVKLKDFIKKKMKSKK